MTFTSTKINLGKCKVTIEKVEVNGKNKIN